MIEREIETALLEIEAKNCVAAFRLLATLAEIGNPAAMCNLAILYQCGLGVQTLLHPDAQFRGAILELAKALHPRLKSR